MTTHWAQNDIVVNDTRMHYYRMGNRECPPLVLVHGFSDNGLCWLSLARDLAAEYDILMPDVRGHGQSARVERHAKLDLAADVAGVIQGLGLTAPIVAGHSLGAMMAAQLGARFPDIARALILEDPPLQISAPTMGDKPIFTEDGPMAQWVKSLATLPLEQAIEKNRADHPTWSEGVLHRWTEGKQQLDPNFFTTDFTSGLDWHNVLESITCPTLVLSVDPGQGGIVTPELAQQITQMNPLITTAHIPNTGHHIRFGNYDAYLAAVKAFLKEVE